MLPGRRFVPSEARRLKKLLDLSDRCGLEGLAEALPLRCTSLANEWEILWEDDALVFRITGLPRAERPRAQGNGVPPLQERGRTGVRRLRRRLG